MEKKDRRLQEKGPQGVMTYLLLVLTTWNHREMADCLGLEMFARPVLCTRKHGSYQRSMGRQLSLGRLPIGQIAPWDSFGG